MIPTLITREQVVEALTQGGPAEECGKLATGDVLQSIDGSPVANMTDRKSIFILYVTWSSTQTYLIP